jgi:hypothetical protein
MEIPSIILKFLKKLDSFFMFNGGLQFFSTDKIIKYWTGKSAFHKHYDEIRPTDVPFAQDYFGDQFLLREKGVIKLYAETGEIEKLNLTISDWYKDVCADPENKLNISFQYSVAKGELLFAYPPFCFKEGAPAKIKAVPEPELIQIHFDLYKKIKNLKDGEKIRFVAD